MNKKMYLFASLVIALSSVLVFQTLVNAGPKTGYWKNQPVEEWPMGTIQLGNNFYNLQTKSDTDLLQNWPGQSAVWMIGKGAQPGRCAGSCHMDLPAWHSFDELVQARFILGEKIITAQFSLLANGLDPTKYSFIANANAVYADPEATRSDLLNQATLVNAALNQALHKG